MSTDPVDLALELLDELERDPRHEARLIRGALAGSGDHPDVVAVILDHLASAWTSMPLRPELWHVLAELGERSTGTTACRARGLASDIAAVTDSPDVAFELALAALRAVPSDADALVRCSEFADPDRRPVVAEAFERLAQQVVAGTFPAPVFDHLLDSFASAGAELDRARRLRD